MSLREQIEQEIRERGPIPFSRYMEICLYDPAAGYYSRHAEQFGKAGDFYTASDVHAVFGRLLARQFDEMWRALDRPPEIELLELGPGRGLFARDVLDWSKKKFPDFFAALHYTPQEASPALRTKLQDTLREHVGTGKAAVPGERPSLAQRFTAGNGQNDDQALEGRPTHIHRTCSTATPLIVFANEFFDALPVEILGTEGKLHLALENSRLREVWLPPTAEELEFLDRYGVHPEPGERIEVPLLAQDWIQHTAHSIERGFLVVIDYGYTRAEQLAGHHRGTLMAYRHHSASPDPYQAPGEQDLTAHVAFTALAAAAADAGMDVQPLRTQSHFLMRIGETNQFADAFEDCNMPQERAKVTLQLKHLVTPAGMGENFQVLIASRGVRLQNDPGHLMVKP
ncbi:MAG: SAM-dependent methyltransferase [Acidobacteriales bacterium]|nr:SAM-dependent methyltransferase [Candidatus Koribacter versatilis]MBI3644744.1 SAM-dependent methyltransferase [Terriglobales bacterium]